MNQAFYNRLGVPVTASNREVIRAVRNKLMPEFRSSRYVRASRHRLLHDVLDLHDAARKLYIHVTQGNI